MRLTKSLKFIIKKQEIQSNCNINKLFSLINSEPFKEMKHLYKAIENLEVTESLNSIHNK